MMIANVRSMNTSSFAGESMGLGGILYFFTERYITICDFVNESGFWIEYHNVEMLNCLNRFQRPPVFEPYKLLLIRKMFSDDK